MKDLSRLAIVLLIVLVVLNALVFASMNPDRIVPGTDSVQYDLLARNLLAGHGFTLESEPPYVPTLFREPGYPALVAVLYWLQGIDAVVVVQAVLLGLTAGLTAIVGTRLFGQVEGLIGGALFGLNSESAHYAHWLLTEIPFTFLLVAALGLALRAHASQRSRDFVACGVLLGLASLVRVIAVPLAAPLCLVLALRENRGLRGVVLMLASFAIVIAPWVARNYVTFGQPTISSRLGVNLIRRSARAAEPLSAYPAWIVASVWMATNPLSDLVFPISRFQWGPSYEDNLIWDFHVNDMVRYNSRYEPVCQPRPDPDACYAEIGLAFVRAYPVGYMVQSVFALVTLLFAPLPGPQALEHNGLVWLGLLAMTVLAIRRQLCAAHWLLLGPLLTYVAASIAVDTQVRYLLPVMPIFAIFGAAPLAALVRRLMRYPRRSPALGSTTR